MGNHEYCEDCGASSFHHGSPCDPELKAKKDAERAEADRLEQRRRAASEAIIAKLGGSGYAYLNSYGSLTIADPEKLLDLLERQIIR